MNWLTRIRPVASASCSSRIARLGLRGLMKPLKRRTLATMVAVRPGSKPVILTKLA